MSGDNGAQRAFLLESDSWLTRPGRDGDVITSSRVRLARNLPDVAFPMRAHVEDLQNVATRVAHGLENCEATAAYRRVNLSDLTAVGRSFLRENHLISAEFEKGGDYRFVSIAPNYQAGVMVNEEDHVRLFCTGTGFCLRDVLQRAVGLDEALHDFIGPAYSKRLGYLTACPTNTGTGMRASVMLHLPGLRISQRIQEITELIPENGLTVRGFYGEHSDYLGDYFQISNERTLGKSEEEIVEILSGVVERIAEKEREARDALFEERTATAEDVVWRSYAILTSARVINTAEAAKLLARLRLGIDRRYFPGLSHEGLSQLFVKIQPGHLQFADNVELDSEGRDELRARLLRDSLKNIDRAP